MKKSIITTLLASAMIVGVGVAVGQNKPKETLGYNASSLPTTIDLNDTSASNIRSYYSSLNNLSTSERQGTNLLKNLKTILKNGQKYYSYENGTSIWQMYEITDRDWAKSPANSTTYGTYNSSTNKITNYTYGTSSSSSKNNPYIHALYINRDVNNQTTAWDNHNQDQWGINREHVWPKAEGFDSSGAGGARGDPMHLMAGNGYANNIHSNYYYGYVKTSASYTDCGSKYSNQSGNLRGTSKTLNTGTVFEPQDSDKGDIARAIFYMVARYNYLSKSDSDGIDANNPNLTLTQNISDWSSSGYTSSTSTQGKLGVLTDLLAWHHADPVDEYEIHRNNLLYTNFTNNRNPFIDFPEWVDYIWGTATYSGSTYQSYSSTPTGYANPNSDTINGYNSGGATVSVTGVSLNKNSTSIEVGGAETLEATIAPSNATNQGVTWSTSNSSIAIVSNGVVRGVAEGSATITVTSSDGGFTATCSVTVTAASGGGGGSGASGTAVYTVSSKTAVTPSGDVPDGSSATFENDSSNAGQLTYGKYLTLTLSGYDGLTVTGLTLSAKSNQSKGKAEMSFTTDGNTIASIVDSTFNSSSWYGSWSTSYVDIVFPSTNHNLTEQTVGTGKTLVLTVRNNGASNTTNSIYIESMSITYESESDEKALDSIFLDTSDAPTTFNVGDTFSYEGLSVTAYYDDGTDDIVTPTSVSTPDLSSAGQKTVTVTYTEGGVTKTATYTITVNAVTLESIEVSGAKTAYYVGDSFVKPTVTATYSNGSTSVVSNDATFSGYNLSNAGNQTVTVSYTNGTTVSTTYSITVTALAVTDLTISGYTTVFTVGDSFSYGGTVTATYNNGSTADVTSSATCSGYNMSSASSQTVTVSFGGQSKTYQITVNEAGGGATDSTQYELINSTSDLEAGKSYIITNGTSGTVKAAAVTDNTNNRKSTEVTVSNNKITRGSSALSFTLGGSSGSWTFATENYAGTAGYLASGSSSTNNHLRVISTAGTATIAFSGDAATINIGPHASRTLICFNSGIDSPNGGFACYSAQGSYGLVYLWKEVQAKVLSSISLDTTNVQKTFSVGDTFTYSGLVVTANYTNASSEVVTPTSVSTPDMSSTGNKIVTVTYQTVSNTYLITVNSSPSISWTAPTINVYTGSTLSGTDVNGWAVTYNDGAGHQTVLTYSQITVKLGGTTISIPHTWVAADDGKTLTATYNSLTTSASNAVQVTQSINSVSMQSEATENTSNLTFTAACGGSGTADDGKSWTVTSDGTESSYDSTKGIHYGTSSAAVQYILLSSSVFTTGTITEVVVNASVASGVTNTTVSVRIGGNQFGGTGRTLTTTATDYTFSGSVAAGTIEVEIRKPESAVKAIYCKSVVVTYTTPGSSTIISNNVSHTAAQRVAVKFAKAFNAAMDTTINCTANMSSAWSTCSSAYNTFLSEAAALGSTEEAYAKNLVKYATRQYSDDSGEACLERMMKTYELCVQKHGQTAFMSDIVTLGRTPTINVVSSNSTATIIIVSTLICGIAVGGYFVLRRKKEI